MKLNDSIASAGSSSKVLKPRLDDLIHSLWNTPERAEWSPKTEIIRLDELRIWMHSGDIEVLGFVEHTIHCGKFRIEPLLSQDEYLDFRKRYVDRCFKENPNSEWADTRYGAGWDLADLIVDLWKTDANQPALADLKKWLAELYKAADDELRMCIVNATLEHMPPKVLRALFSDWKNDPLLRRAYELASFQDKLSE